MPLHSPQLILRRFSMGCMLVFTPLLLFFCLTACTMIVRTPQRDWPHQRLQAFPSYGYLSHHLPTAPFSPTRGWGWLRLGTQGRFHHLTSHGVHAASHE